MKIEAGKFYKCRDGSKAYVAAIRTDTVEYRAIGWVLGEDGSFAWSGAGDYWTRGGPIGADLTSEWREPLTVEAWCNVYVDGGRSWYKSKDEADTASGWVKSTTRIACIYMSGKEGVGP